MREAAEAVAILLSLVAPYTAEEMWSRLGHEPTVARAGWPTVDEALLVEDSVTAVVQVQGKLRARLEVSPDISEADLEAAALADRVGAACAGGQAGPQGDRARAQAGQRRRRLRSKRFRHSRALAGPAASRGAQRLVRRIVEAGGAEMATVDGRGCAGGATC